MTESKDTKQKLLKKQDMILIAVILAAAVLLFLGAKLMHKSPAEIVEVSVDGKVVETLDLAKDHKPPDHQRWGGVGLRGHMPRQDLCPPGKDPSGRRDHRLPAQ